MNTIPATGDGQGGFSMTVAGGRGLDIMTQYLAGLVFIAQRLDLKRAPLLIYYAT